MSKDKYLKLFSKNLTRCLGDRRPAWLAREAQVSQSTISRILSGEISPALETIVAIASALEIEPASLLSDKDPKPIIVQKTITHELDAGQVEAIKTLLREMREQDDLEQPEVLAIKDRVPKDILEALANNNYDWNFVRSALDIPEVKEENKGRGNDAG